MSLLQYRIAVQSLRMNRARTALTTLGIIIGVASITLVLALGGGIENTVRGELTKLDNNVILVSSGVDTSLFDDIENYTPYGISAVSSLTEQDYNSLKLNSDIAAVAPLMVLDGTITTSTGVSKNVPIVATSPQFAEIIGLKAQPGQFIDNTVSRDAIVIGAKLASQLYETNQLLGQQLTLKGRSHNVVGVLKQTNTPINMSGVNLDSSVFISFDNGKSFNQGVAQIQQLLVTVKDINTLEEVRQSIDQTILANHRNERDFTVYAGQDVASHGNSSFQAIVMMTALVATITLVVGGIGIMNIMLVGVSERTREIGIRKALGATNGHILGQFLIEALIMCIIGGIIGLGLAYSLAFLIAMQLSFQPAYTWQIVVIGLGMAFVTGIVFGLYPAVKAARKDPIESLRQYH